VPILGMAGVPGSRCQRYDDWVTIRPVEKHNISRWRDCVISTLIVYFDQNTQFEHRISCRFWAGDTGDQPDPHARTVFQSKHPLSIIRRQDTA
jgi:hypothetical protein